MTTDQQPAAAAFDAFEALTQRFSTITAIHNVQLIDTQPGEGGYTRLIVQHQGTTRELVSGAPWPDDWSRRHVGKFGHLVPVKPVPGATQWPQGGACYFRAYEDPSLRRVPELDDGQGNNGWSCASRTFLAPAHIIPGAEGRFVADETVPVTVRVPPEFARQCERVQLTPQQLLEGFMADAGGIQNYVNCPRADRFGSNGSDERDMAEAYIDRAYGGQAIDLEARDAQRYEDEERQLERDDFSGLLDDFIDSGGQADELLKAVQVLVDQQRAKSER